VRGFSGKNKSMKVILISGTRRTIVDLPELDAKKLIKKGMAKEIGTKKKAKKEDK
jgi:hypothetical protein